MFSKAHPNVFDRDGTIAQPPVLHATFSHTLRAQLRNPKARFWMLASLLGMVAFAGFVAAVSYNTRPLTTPQVTAMLVVQAPEVRRLAIADMQADYGINALGDPITLVRVLEAIETAKDRVEYDRLVADENAASTKSRSMLDIVSTSVERTK